MPLLAAAVPVGIWLILALVVVIMLMSAYEYLGLPPKRLVATVASKEFVARRFNPQSVVSQTEGDVYSFSDWLMPESHFVSVLLNGRTYEVTVASGVYDVVIEGSEAVLVCIQGRLSGRITPLSLELPMPSAPNDPAQIM